MVEKAHNLPNPSGGTIKAASQVRAKHLIVLTIIVTFGAFLRLYQIGGTSLWMDEFWSIEMSMGRGSLHDHLPVGVIQTQDLNPTALQNALPWWNIWTHMAGVAHPPLYFLVLRWWMDVFGSRPAATRSLSALFSLLAVLVLFDICRLLHGTRIALLAAALMAVAGAQIDFAQETRSYPMLILLGLCCADAIVRIEFLGVSRQRLAALTVALSAMALTHYFALGALAALGLYALLRLRGPARWKTLAAFAASLAIVVALWGPWFIAQLHSYTSFLPGFLADASAHRARNTLFRLVGLPSVFLFGRLRAVGFAPAITVAVALLTILLPAARLPWRGDLLLWVLWIFTTLGFIAVQDIFHHSALLKYERYTMLASPAIYACLAGFDWPKKLLWRDLLPLFVLGILAVLAWQRTRDGAAAKEDWRQFAGDLNANVGPDELMVFYGNDPWLSAGTWYTGFKYYCPQSHRPWLIVKAANAPDFDRQLQRRNSLWLIGLHPAAVLRNLLPGWTPVSVLENPTVGVACHMIRIGGPRHSDPG